MKQKRDQFVIACLSSSRDADTVLPYAQQCADHLGKGLVALTCGPAEETEWVTQLGVPYAALRCEWHEAIANMPALLGAVLAIAVVNPQAPRSAFSNPRRFLRNFAECKTAYIALPTDFHTPRSAFRSVALTLTHHRESKEKLIWASYFARFFASRIRILHHTYHDETLHSRWRNNMRYLDKVFGSLNLSYEEEELTLSSEFANPDFAALTRQGIDLLIALATDQRDRDLADLLMGPPELRLLRRAGSLPILLLNRRDDLYVLCD